MTADQGDLVAHAALLGFAKEHGQEVPQSVISMLRAIAETNDEATRHRMAADAVAQAGEIGAIARDLIRIAIFAL